MSKSVCMCIYIFIVFAVFVSIMLAVDGSGEESNNIFCSIYCIYLGEFLCHSMCHYIHPYVFVSIY